MSALVRQRGRHDCGIACVAMFCGVHYEKVWYFARRWHAARGKETFHGSPLSLIQGIVRRITGRGVTPHHCSVWDEIPRGAIVSVRYDDHPDCYHWVIKDRESDDVLDPGVGRFSRDELSFDYVCHYIC